MTCIIASIQGGNPEIFPIPVDAHHDLEQGGRLAMAAALGMEANDVVRMEPRVEQFIGSALRPDGSAFYLTTLAPKIDDCITNPWRAAFFSPFGIGDIAGTVTGTPTERQITTLTVDARLSVEGETRVSVSWSVIGSQRTAPNKSALINSIRIIEAGPHHAEDIRRCIALHGPQRIFGEPRAIVAMQCGVAAACLLEAIC